MNIFKIKSSRLKRILPSIILFFTVLILLLLPRSIVAQEISSKSLSTNILLDRAEKAYLSGDRNEAIEIWQGIIRDRQTNPEQLAAAYNNLASISWQRGDSRSAIQYWQEATAIYRQNPPLATKLAPTLVDTARAYNDLGQTRFSLPLLTEALNITSDDGLSTIEDVIYLAIGNARAIDKKYTLAIEAYQQSLKHLDRNRKDLEIIAWQNISESYQQQAIGYRRRARAASREGDIRAQKLWQQTRYNRDMSVKSALKAVKIAENVRSLASAKAFIHLAKLAKNYDLAIDREKLRQQAATKLSATPESINKVYVLLNFAKSSESEVEKAKILTQAIDISQALASPRAMSFAAGAMGQYYVAQQDYEKALYWTKQAQFKAQAIQALDSLYKWDGQAARIYNRLGDKQEAIVNYERAIASLQVIRGSTIEDSQDSASDFQNDIEPIYRNLMKLLLAEDTRDIDFQKVLEIKDLLSVSELENFFQDDCWQLKTSTETEKLAYLRQNNSAIVNTIILRNKTYLIWQFPNGRYARHAIDISKKELKNIVTKWRFDLENKENDNYLELSQQIYNLFFPAEIKSKLDNTQTEKIVFINDGILRNVPMAALYDGHKFLVENYAISNSLGLKIPTNPEQDSIKKAMAFGLTVAIDNFPPLPYVKQELTKLSRLVDKKQFLDSKFNYSNFKREIESNPFSLIHIATHGQFSGTSENTFLQAYQSQINLQQLEETLSNHNNNFSDRPIQLLVLSACDTATSNPRATLGMSGVAIRAGVSNVLGSLWAVSDRETVLLIDGFYRHWLQEKLSKPEALRQAQLDLIASPNNHPSNWSSTVLIQG